MFDWLHDKRTNCWSVLGTMVARDYINLVQRAHEQRGGLSGQREVLKTTTAKRIRDRMVADIRLGAVLPPVVIGAAIGGNAPTNFPLDRSEPCSSFLPESTKLSIIDGMQRTAALIEAVQRQPSVADHTVRVEFWLAPNVQAMVYRMLVLNTGQVPWTLSRQLSVVYAQLVDDIRANVPEITRIFSDDDPGQRTAAGQFASDDLAELYIAFSVRKTAIDAREAISEEFSKIDFVENLSRESFQDHFYLALKVLGLLDAQFCRFETQGEERFDQGRAIFDGQPARIGLVVALAQHLLGRPGLDTPDDERDRRATAVRKNATELVRRLEESSAEAVGEFLKLDILREILSKRVGQVGRFERTVFFEAFKVLIDLNFQVPSMEPCWLAN